MIEYRRIRERIAKDKTGKKVRGSHAGGEAPYLGSQPQG
jgi:hypothetical protein